MRTLRERCGTELKDQAQKQGVVVKHHRNWRTRRLATILVSGSIANVWAFEHWLRAEIDKIEVELRNLSSQRDNRPADSHTAEGQDALGMQMGLGHQSGSKIQEKDQRRAQPQGQQAPKSASAASVPKTKQAITTTPPVGDQKLPHTMDTRIGQLDRQVADLTKLVGRLSLALTEQDASAVHAKQPIASRPERESESAEQTTSQLNEAQATEPREKLRLLFGKLIHPVAIVTAQVSGTAEDHGSTWLTRSRGVTVSSLNMVALDQTAVLSFNLKVPSRTWDAIRTNPRIGIHLLPATRLCAGLANIFSLPHDDPARPFKMALAHSGPHPRLSPLDSTSSTLEFYHPVETTQNPVTLSATVLLEKCTFIMDHVVVFAQVSYQYLQLLPSEPLKLFNGLAYSTRTYRRNGNIVDASHFPEPKAVEQHDAEGEYEAHSTQLLAGLVQKSAAADASSSSGSMQSSTDHDSPDKDGPSTVTAMSDRDGDVLGDSMQQHDTSGIAEEETRLHDEPKVFAENAADSPDQPSAHEPQSIVAVSTTSTAEERHEPPLAPSMAEVPQESLSTTSLAKGLEETLSTISPVHDLKEIPSTTSPTDDTQEMFSSASTEGALEASSAAGMAEDAYQISVPETLKADVPEYPPSIIASETTETAVESAPTTTNDFESQTLPSESPDPRQPDREHEPRSQAAPKSTRTALPKQSFPLSSHNAWSTNAWGLEAPQDDQQPGSGQRRSYSSATARPIKAKKDINDMVTSPDILKNTVGEFMQEITSPFTHPRGMRHVFHASRVARYDRYRLDNDTEKHPRVTPESDPEGHAYRVEGIRINESFVARRTAATAGLELHRMLDRGSVDPRRSPWLEGALERGLVVLQQELARLEAKRDVGDLDDVRYEQLVVTLQGEQKMLTDVGTRLRAMFEDDEGFGSGVVAQPKSTDGASADARGHGRKRMGSDFFKPSS